AMRLAAAGAFPGMLTTVLLTHLHSDHICDFNDVFTTRWVMSPVENPLEVVGPVGTDRFVSRTVAMLEDDIAYRSAHHDDQAEQDEELWLREIFLNQATVEQPSIQRAGELSPDIAFGNDDLGPRWAIEKREKRLGGDPFVTTLGETGLHVVGVGRHGLHPSQRYDCQDRNAMPHQNGVST
ncbi:MAG: MBL fold metallo-hydrolase, partial [Myxococcales bacterium]